jgi:tetratricopeptide (TPR) repeat protein
MRAGDWTAAQKACEAELMRHPTIAKTHGLLGMCLYRQEKWAEAGEAFRRATALDHHFWEAGVKHAQCLTKLGKFDEALKVAEEWHHLRPNDTALAGLIDFLRPRVRGEYQRWEATVGLNHTVHFTHE